MNTADSEKTWADFTSWMIFNENLFYVVPDELKEYK